jgi:precorrin-3B C17-methyltransferase
MREELLHYYERELTYLRRMGAEFAQRYPKVASRLLLEPHKCEDPHVERMLEAFAFLAARVHLKLDDDFPEVSESLLSVVYPQHVRPIPAMSMVELRLDPDQGKLTTGYRVKRDTMLYSRPVDGVPCKFRTCYDTTLWPVAVAGAQWLTPEADAALAAADDVVGYGPYVARVPERRGQRRHPSDNRVEAQRARHALELAAAGARVAVVSSGDPGIFAMASAVLEALDGSDAELAGVDVRVVPGLSAMQAAAARVGAPLGHDFCVLSLSDQLKPWEIVERRLDAAGAADLVLALYNPASRTRREQLARAIEVLRRHRAPETPVVVARAVGADDETVAVTTLAGVDLEAVDMRTLLIVGSSATRVIAGGDGAAPRVYTPRRYP